MNLSEVLTNAEKNYEDKDYNKAAKNYTDAQKVLLENYERLNVFINDRISQIISEITASEAAEDFAGISVPSEPRYHSEPDKNADLTNEPDLSVSSEVPPQEANPAPVTGTIDDVGPEQIPPKDSTVAAEKQQPAPAVGKPLNQELPIDDVMQNLDRLEEKTKTVAETAPEKENKGATSKSLDDIDIDELLKNVNL